MRITKSLAGFRPFVQVPAHDKFHPTHELHCLSKQQFAAHSQLLLGWKGLWLKRSKICTWHAGREQAGNKSLFYLSGWNVSWDFSVRNALFLTLLLKFQGFFPHVFSLPIYSNILISFYFWGLFNYENSLELWSCERTSYIVTPFNLTAFEKWVRNMVLVNIFWDIFPKWITVDASPFILIFLFLSDYSLC